MPSLRCGRAFAALTVLLWIAQQRPSWSVGPDCLAPGTPGRAVDGWLLDSAGKGISGSDAKIHCISTLFTKEPLSYDLSSQYTAAVIGGRVVDEAGHPLEGATITMVRNSDSINEFPDELAEKPVTDADGFWCHGPVPQDDLTIFIQHSSGLTAQYKELVPNAPGNYMDILQSGRAVFVLPVLREVEFSVIDMVGNPLSGATISGISENPAVFLAEGTEPGYLNDGMDRFRLENTQILSLGGNRYRLITDRPTTYSLVTRHEGFVTDIRKIDMRIRQEPFEVRLRPGRKLRVRVLGPNGIPLSEGVRAWVPLPGVVHIWGMPPLVRIELDAPDTFRLETGDERPRFSSGRFEWNEAPEGRVTFNFAGSFRGPDTADGPFDSTLGVGAFLLDCPLGVQDEEFTVNLRQALQLIVTAVNDLTSEPIAAFEAEPGFRLPGNRAEWGGPNLTWRGHLGDRAPGRVFWTGMWGVQTTTSGSLTLGFGEDSVERSVDPVYDFGCLSPRDTSDSYDASYGLRITSRGFFPAETSFHRLDAGVQRIEIRLEPDLDDRSD